METVILDGTDCQKRIFNKIKNEIIAFKEKYNKIPGIAFVAFVGHSPLLKYIISLHERTAKMLGFNVTIETCSHTSSKEEVFKTIDKLNIDKNIHAIVFLQPMPESFNPLHIIERIDVDKEVEGFHPLNVLNTLTKGVQNSNYPMCLPVALFELFKSANVQIEGGEEFVFLADQDFISNPFRSLVLCAASSQVVPPGCSFSFVNTDNEKIGDFCKRADFLFVISENPEFLQSEWLKPGVCIVDIYSNLIKEVPSKKNPEILIPVIRGGVNTDSVKGIASKIAPCPGGLMPILLAVLFRNAFIAFVESL